MTILTTEQHISQPQLPKKRKIIRKKKSTPKSKNPNEVTKVVSLNTNTKKRKIIRKKKALVKKENKPINNESGSEDDIECVFTVCWYHRNYSYLLDENTQEVFDRKDHSLLGLRYINEDELSDIDYNYANYND